MNEFEKSYIERSREQYFDLLIKAEKEAFRRGIKANSIVINENMCEVKPEWFYTGNRALELPPMICGMNVYFTRDELPENYSFAIFEGPPNRLAEFESIGMEPSELRKAAEIYKTIKEKML